MFASVTGQGGVLSVFREDVVSLCSAHDALRSLNQPVVYADPLCLRNDARFSGNRNLLRKAPWDRIRRRDFRPDPDSLRQRTVTRPRRWFGVPPITAVGAIACKSEVAADRLRGYCPGLDVPLVSRADLLW